MSRPCSRSASEQPVSRCNLIANSSATRFALPPSQGRITPPSSNRTFQPPNVGSPSASVPPISVIGKLVVKAKGSVRIDGAAIFESDEGD